MLTPQKVKQNLVIWALPLALISFQSACSKNSQSTGDAGGADAGVVRISDAVVRADLGTDIGPVSRPDAEVAADADTPDAGFERFPQTARLLSESGADYREPFAITSNPNEPNEFYFSAITASGEAGIFELNAEGNVNLLFQGEPLILPVALKVNTNGRLLHIVDLVAESSGKLLSFDLRLRTMEELAPLTDFQDPAGIAFDPDIPALLFTGRFPGVEEGTVWELQAADITPMPIPLDPALVLNDPSHIIRLASNPTMYVYDAHSEATQFGRIYQILEDGNFTVVADNIRSNYPGGIDHAIDESYLLISTSTPATSGGDTLHIVDLSESPPTRSPLVLPQKLREPRGIHRIPNSNRWLVVDGRGGANNNGAIYELE